MVDNRAELSDPQSFTPELVEAIAVVVARYWGVVMVPALGINQQVLRELAIVFAPLKVTAQHKAVPYTDAKGVRRVGDFLRFDHVDQVGDQLPLGVV